MAGISSVYRTLSRHVAALCAFDFVARYGNFTSAADAFGMTQSALSQRIKGLENELGVSLFTREHRGVALTDDGRRLLEVVRPAMEQMGFSVSSLLQRKEKPYVRLSLDYAFSSFWMLPKLPRLRDDLNEIDLQILASQTPLEAAGSDCDLLIHMCRGSEMGKHDVLLMREEVVAVCSPEFLKSNGPIGNAADLLHLPLLSLAAPASATWHTWQSWLASLHVAGQPTREFTSLSNYDLVIQAALTGQGLALGWLGLIDELLKDGRLVQVTDDVVTSDVGYVITRAASSREADPARVFDWICSQGMM